MADDTLRLSITKRWYAAPDVVVLVLANDSGVLPPWSPGAHITVHISDDMSREYSLCGDFDTSCASWTIAVKLDSLGRGGSRYLHEQIVVGSQLEVTQPRNNFPLSTSTTPVLFVAGGIGITPIMPMMASVHRDGTKYSCLYLGSDRESMPFADQLQAAYADKITIFASKQQGKRYELQELFAGHDPLRIYACGPNELIEALKAAADEHEHVDLRVEYFSPRSVTTHAQALTDFEVELAGSGEVIDVSAQRSILDALLDADVDIMSSCEEGTCGTCEVKVISGIPDHRDSVLSKAEQATNSRMLPCVSGSRSRRLVIDLL
jgi:ferredoxin-NADP reductase